MADVPAHEPDVDQGQPLAQGRATTSSCRTTPRATAASAPGHGRASSRSTPTPTIRSTRTTATPTRSSAPSTNYTEIDAFSEVKGKRYISEFYLQDTWKATRRLTLDYGVRFLWYTPWYSETAGGGLRARAVRSGEGAAALSAGAHQQRQRRASIRSTGETLPNVFVGTFVPGTGDRYNGMVSNADPNYPKGFRDNQGIEPEPRVGLAWDLTGDSKTALHASVGLYHNPHVNANGLDAMARNPPAQNTPSIIYGTMDTLLAAGAQGAFSNRPSDVFGVERDAKTPKSYNYSVGVQREIGWGTVLDVTYAGFQMRNAEMATSINTVPDGARFVDVNPAEREPAESDHGQAERVPAAVSRLSEHHDPRALRPRVVQLAAGAAQSPLHQRAAVCRRLHLRRRPSPTARAATRPGSTRCGPATRGTKARRPRPSCTTWSSTTRGTCRTGAGCGTTSLTRGLLDGWQLSGDTAWVSGDWAGASTSTTDNFDFTGGDGGTRPRHQRRPDVQQRQLRPDPGWNGKLLQRRRRSAGSPAAATSATRRSPSTGCRRSCCRTCRSSRTSSLAAASGSSSAGRPTTSSTR